MSSLSAARAYAGHLFSTVAFDLCRHWIHRAGSQLSRYSKNKKTNIFRALVLFLVWFWFLFWLVSVLVLVLVLVLVFIFGWCWLGFWFWFWFGVGLRFGDKDHFDDEDDGLDDEYECGEMTNVVWECFEPML